MKSILLFILTGALFISMLFYEKNSEVYKLESRIKIEHHNQLDSATLDFKNQTDLIFYNMINQDKVLKLQFNALHAKTKEQRAIYRDHLYKELEPLYLQLKKFGIKQLHFHFPDTTSFLRFHKPSRFGDNLKDIRHSLVLTNTTLKYTSGFEEGRIFNGYRFVYPLIYNNEHIGSVETSIGFNAINERSKAIYNTYQYMILNKHIIQDKVFSTEQKNYAVSDIDDDFFHEANTFVDNKKAFLNWNGSLSYETFIQINKKLKNLTNNKDLQTYNDLVKFIKIGSYYYAVSFHPIHNIKNENMGYIISYNRSIEYENLLSKFYLKTLMLLILLLFIYKMQSSREKLKKYSAIAHEQKEKAMEASRSKSEFLANMSHEIRTPLNAILGFIEILQKEDRDRKSLSYVNIIHDSSHTLLQIIEDILDFSKIESGKLEIDAIDFNTRKEFKVITHLFEAKCSQKDISLSLILDNSLPEFIHADPLRIKQVVSNLLSNAIKFTSNGKKIIVNITYANSRLTVSVIDQGIGIAKDKQEHIFEAFNQEDSSTTRLYGGTGLGLSISSELVKLMGGELQLKSELGVGSEFYFTIPVSIGSPIKIESTDDQDIVLKGNILLVEDNKTNQQFMQIVLGDMELECDVADDGLVAIEMFTNNKYDLILMDENMPNMGGIEATSKIRELERSQNLTRTPIIALTANALKGDKEKFINAGMDEYVSKPVDTHLLTSILSKLLKK
jgi:signal transduction histidine kinase/CheY-like chemotaxis protein